MRKLSLNEINQRLDNRGLKCVEYNGALSNSRFVCKHNHEWHALPSNIFAGNGCPSCAGIKRYSISDVQLELSKRNFTCVDYGGTTHSNSIFQCEKGHQWSTSFSHLLRGACCPWCSKMYPYDLKRINDEIKIKNIKCLFYCGNVKGKSTFECECGQIWQTKATNVLNRTGCPACSKSGYNPSKPGFLYLLQSENGLFVKVGITNNLTSRMTTLKRKTPFQFQLIDSHKYSNGSLPPKLEKKLLKSYESAKLSEFDGATEWLLANKNISQEFANVKN